MKTRPEDIVFVINPMLWYENMYPSGILCLSGYLEARGFSNIILDSKISSKKIERAKREKMILSCIEEMNPKVVCFSSTHREFEEVVRINNQIKLLNDRIITIVGGSQPTYRATDFLDNGFDFVCRGVGEETLYEFVGEVFAGTFRWERIKGLAWKNKEGNMFNQPREFDKEDAVINAAMPAYDKIDKRYFDMNIGIIRGLAIKGAVLLTTRGCPFSCSYCGCNLIFGRKLHFKSLENIEREIKFLREHYDIEGVWIADDTFTINAEHIIGICGILKKYNLIWACQSRVNTINEKLIKIMKESGCVQIDFGVESGSQRILDDIIGKGITVEQAISAFNLAKKYKLRTFANFMIGLPTENYEDLRKTKEVADLIDADVYMFSIATPLPGTRLYDMVNEEISPHEYSLLNWSGSVLTEKLNKSELNNLAEERAALENKYILRSKLKLILSLRNYSFFMKRKYKYQRLQFIVNYFIGELFGYLKLRDK